MRDTEGPIAAVDAGAPAGMGIDFGRRPPVMTVSGFTQAQLDSLQRAGQSAVASLQRQMHAMMAAPRPSKPKPRRKGSKLARRCAARGRG